MRAIVIFFSHRLILDAVPFLATLAVDQFVGFVVAFEHFLLGIPIQFAPQFIADVGELANGCRAMTGAPFTRTVPSRMARATCQCG